MTVHYKIKLSRASRFRSIRTLFRWNGSIYKLVWPDLLLFMFIYFTISYFYRFAFTKSQQVTFVGICKHFSKSLSNIPLSFMLGFYVSILIERWWNQALRLPWPDEMTILTNVHVRGNDDRGKLIRRNIVRYLNLSYIITFTMMSIPVKARFPTMEHFVQAGLMFPHEKKLFELFHLQHPRLAVNWIPIMWAKSLFTRAHRENRLTSYALAMILENLMFYRGSMGGLLGYDWVNVPLVYTQVVTFATYSFFAFSVIGRQFIIQDVKSGNLFTNDTMTVSKYTFSQFHVDFYFPFFLFFEFFFFMGWLKVGETILNPFGEDDDDFDVNWLIDRNFQVTNLMVDEFHDFFPELEKDPYFDTYCQDIPYNLASIRYKVQGFPGSTNKVTVAEKYAQFVPLDMEPKGKRNQRGF